MILISKYLQLQNQTTIQSLHAKKKKKNLVSRKFVKKTEKTIFSLVFVCFCFTEISYFMNFPTNENVRKQHLSANAYIP